MSFEAVVHEMTESSEPIVFGRRCYSQEFGAFKRTGLLALRPEIMAIGSSRAMQFRSLMFPERRFWNAGGALQSAGDFRSFAIDVSKGILPVPECCLVSLDFWWLRDGPDVEIFHRADPVTHLSGHVAAVRQLMKIAVSGRPLLPGDVDWGYRTIGAGAAMSGSGFRRDGSRMYSPSVLIEALKNSAFVDRERPPFPERVRDGYGRFRRPFRFDESRADLIVDAAGKLNDCGVTVVVLSVPFSTETFAAFQREPETAAVWERFQSCVLEELERMDGVVTFCCPVPEAVGLSDEYMFDGVHPSDVLLCELLARLAEDYPHLRSFWSAEHCRRIASAAVSPLSLDFPAAGDVNR